MGENEMAVNFAPTMAPTRAAMTKYKHFIAVSITIVATAPMTAPIMNDSIESTEIIEILGVRGMAWR